MALVLSQVPYNHHAWPARIPDVVGPWLPPQRLNIALGGPGGGDLTCAKCLTCQFGTAGAMFRLVYLSIIEGDIPRVQFYVTHNRFSRKLKRSNNGPKCG